jgi:hypothetical protein
MRLARAWSTCSGSRRACVTRLRNEKLDEAVKLQGEVTTTLSEAPMGSDVNANERVSQFASDAQEYMLMMNKLWRSGELSYREYMASTNNFKTNAAGYLGQAEKYAANYEKHVERMKADESGYASASGVEVAELARVEDFGNFSRFAPVIDAPTGSIGLVGKDGRRHASVSQLGTAVLSTYDRLNVAALTKQAVDMLGTTVTVLDPEKNPLVETLESPLRNQEYLDAEKNTVAAILDTNDNAVTSTLVDYVSGAYQSQHLDSQDDIVAAADNPELVIMMPSPANPQRIIGAVEDDVTDADFDAYLEQAQVPEELRQKLRDNRKNQKEVAVKAVRGRIRSGLNLKEGAREIAQYKPPSAEVIKLQEAAYERSSDLGDWMELLTGDRDRQDALSHSLAETESAKEAGVTRIDATDPQVVVIYYKDKDPQRIQRLAVGEDIDGMAASLKNWGRAGRAIHGIGGDEVNRILDVRELTGTVTTPEGEVQDAELVEASREAPLEAGGSVPDIEDFNTATITSSYTQAGGTSEGKTEAVQVPVRDYFNDAAKEGQPETIAAAARNIVGQLSNEQLVNTGITTISADDIEEKAGDLGAGIFDGAYYDTISFFVDDVMDREVYIPHSAGHKQVVLALTELVMQKAKRRERLTAAELERFWQSYGDERMNEYNNSLPSVYGMVDAPRRRSRAEAPVGEAPRREPNQR